MTVGPFHEIRARCHLGKPSQHAHADGFRCQVHTTWEGSEFFPDDPVGDGSIIEPKFASDDVGGDRVHVGEKF